MKSVSRIRAVLLDVGGTLWPGQFRSAEQVRAASLTRLHDALHAHPSVDCDRFIERFNASTEELIDNSHAQITLPAIRGTLRAFGLSEDEDTVRAVCRALCLPAVEHLTPFPGVTELLRTIKDLGLRCVIVSNVGVRWAADYQRDFEALGVAGWIDAIISSLDVGYLKPHPAMFEAAVTAAGCPPEACVMVGNSEQADIEPAVALTMRAIRVCIEEPPPERTAAHACVNSLEEAAGVLRQWVASPT